MLSVNPNVLIWGEAFRHCALIQSMSAQFSAFTQTVPRHSEIIDNASGDVNTWIANLSPHPLQLKRSHARFFDHLLGQPARDRGKLIWGLKEVRLSTSHAAYLKWLFPRARFLFLCRNPEDAYCSYRPRLRWYWSWPDKPVFTTLQFGAMWSQLTADYVSNWRGIGGLFLRYEDLEQRTAEIGDYLGFEIANPSQLERVGGIEEGPVWYSPVEKWILRSATRHSARLAGYAD